MNFIEGVDVGYFDIVTGIAAVFVSTNCFQGMDTNTATRRRLSPRALGPFAYLAGLSILGLATFTSSRALLALAYRERVDIEPHALWMFGLGLRMDLVTLGYVLILPTIVVLAVPSKLLKRLTVPLAGYFGLATTLFVLMEVVSYQFIAEYDARPNRLFIEHVGSREVLATIWAQHPLQVVAAAAIVAAAAVASVRLGAWLARFASEWSWKRRAKAFALFTPLVLLSARGTLDHRPLNAASVAFSGQNIVNQLTLNSTYTALRAWYDLRHERSPSEIYGAMPMPEMYERVRRYTNYPPEEEVGVEIPFLHRQSPARALERPRNLVIVLLESLGAEFVGSLGGKPLTPNLDALSREGLWFTSLYSTGTRTVRGIEAVASDFLPTPGSSVVKLGKSQHGFFTIAELLRRSGYATEFVYGGESHFDNMAAFFLGNGFERAFNESDFEDPAFRGTWGVSDEDLMRKANDVFVEHGDRPFFALVLTTSNHSPYEFPDGRIELYDAEKATRNNTVRYADYALGELFRLARNERYFEDTVWVVVADHDERTYGDDLIQVDKFHIPGLILGPDVAPARFERVASQIDLLPTALHLLGIPTVHPMIGRNLFTLDESEPGRAILQFNDIHGFLVGDRLAVHPGGAAPRCFRVRDGGLEPIDPDAELIRDGLAHALLPGVLYGQRLYRLPAR